MKRLMFIAAALFSAAAAAESGVLARATELKKEPFSDAATVQELPAATAVEVLARKGAWMQVKAGAQSGWVRLLAVRMGANAARSGESGLMKAANVALSGSSGTAVATGVRGLDKEQIANASPNPAELAKMDRHAAAEGQARSFAAAAPLGEQTVPYLQ
ncbi:MAG TPA: hypothetical protein VLI06_20235 [Solimonas sp.]|nr:hypothetical protein [Solimonas sp.]